MTNLRQLIVTALLLPGLNGQDIRRRSLTYPGLARRLQDNCTDCTFCAQPFKLEWRPTSIGVAPTATVTVVTIINPDDGGTEVETLPITDFESEYSKYTDSIASTQTAHETVVNDVTVKFPTAVVSFPGEYVWQGALLTDDICSTERDAAVTVFPGAVVEPLGNSQAILPLPDDLYDPHGYYYELHTISTDAALGPYLQDAGPKSCKSNCRKPVFQDFVGSISSSAEELGIVPTGAITPQLSVAFVTTCHRSTSGANKIEDCSPVAPLNNPASPPPTATGGGAGGRKTTTDASGNTIIVAGTAVPPGPDVNGKDGLHAATNAQGHTIIVGGLSGGGGSGEDGTYGQVTLTNAQGNTIVVEGGSLAAVGQGITVTDENGSVMVLQGGSTGTLFVDDGGSTALVAGTITQTAWVPGDTIPGDTGAGAGVAGATASGGTASPTMQDESAARQVPFSLLLSGIALGWTVLLCAIL